MVLKFVSDKVCNKQENSLEKNSLENDIACESASSIKNESVEVPLSNISSLQASMPDNKSYVPEVLAINKNAMIKNANSIGPNKILSSSFSSSFSLVCTKGIKGRPCKEDYAKMTSKVVCNNPITDEMKLKRAELGCQNNNQQLTGLFLLWSRKQITQPQFVSGLYYEELQRKLKRSMGTLAGGTLSSLARINQVEFGFNKQALKNLNINEASLRIQNELDEVIGFVHPNALNIVKKVLQENCLDSAEYVKSLSYINLGIFKKTLDVINQFLTERAISVQEYTKMA